MAITRLDQLTWCDVWHDLHEFKVHVRVKYRGHSELLEFHESVHYTDQLRVALEVRHKLVLVQAVANKFLSSI